MEVKTTRAHTGYRVTIHGEDQLLPPDGGQLYLHFVRPSQSMAAKMRLMAVVDELLDAGVSAEQLLPRAESASGDRQRWICPPRTKRPSTYSNE